MSLHVHHRRALTVLAAAAVLDIALGSAFGEADRIGVGNGLYFATSVATTCGNSPYYPHGWVAYTLAASMHVTMIPLWLAAFSLFTSGLTSSRVRAAEDRAAARAEEHNEAVHARLDAIQAAQHPQKRKAAGNGKGAQEAGTTDGNG